MKLVEATGLEPAASWSQTKHSTKLSYASELPFWRPRRTAFKLYQKQVLLSIVKAPFCIPAQLPAAIQLVFCRVKKRGDFRPPLIINQSLSTASSTASLMSSAAPSAASLTSSAASWVPSAASLAVSSSISKSTFSSSPNS